MASSEDKEGKQPSPWRDLLRDLKDIWNKAALLSSVIAIPALSVSALATWLLAPVNPLLQIVFGTWPLVASSAILIMMILRRSFADMDHGGKFWTISACIVAPYLVAYFFGATDYGDLRGAATKSWVQLLHPGHLLNLVVNVMVYYVSAFSLPRTVSAIACGGFIAWAFQIRLLPHVQRLTAKS